MNKISQADLAKITKTGGKVTRKMGTAPKKPAPAVKPAPEKKPVEMASMGASMVHLEAQAQATLKVLARNTEVIEDFRKDLAKSSSSEPKRVPYVFDVERGKDKLIKRIVATPQNK